MVDFNELLSKPANEIKRPPNVPAGTWRLQVMKYDFVKRGKSQPQTDVCLVTMRLLRPHTKDDGSFADVNAEELAKFAEFYGGDTSQVTADVTFWMTAKAMYIFTEVFLIGALRLDGSRPTKELIPEMVNRECLGTFVQEPSQDGTKFYSNLDSTRLAPIPV